MSRSIPVTRTSPRRCSACSKTPRFHVLRGVHARIPVDALCLAGGCAMNSVANGKIRTNTPFRDVFIQPAAGDNGTALGAALEAWHASGTRPAGPRMEHSYWGTEYDAAAIAAVIRDSGVVEQGRCTWTTLEDEAALCRATATRLADGDIVGWFQGRMEWGARALGNRSILADPRRRDMRDIINQKIKFRERFRPFAPSILAEAIDEYFVDAVHDPFMIQVYPVRPEKRDVHSGGDARRRVGPAPVGEPDEQSAVLGADPGVRRRRPACRCCSTRPSTRTSRSSNNPRRRSIVFCAPTWTCS